MNPELPPPLQPEPVAGKGQAREFLLGCSTGCLVQLVCFGIGFLLAANILGNREETLALSSWGVTQWLVLFPLILKRRRQGRRQVVLGMIASGCVGLLLSSACASMFWNFSVR